MSSVLNTVISLVRTPSMFIAIIAFLGLVLQKKSFSDIIKGTLKTFIGMVILTQGVNILSCPVRNTVIQTSYYRCKTIG